MARRGGFVVSISTEGQLKGRIPKGQPGAGRFMSPAMAYSEMERINRQAREDVQAQVVSNIEDRIKRRAVSTGRLLRVTADSRNSYATRFGWGVGNESFLDNSTAKYWRQIEEGYGGHVGREITGIWGGSIIGISGDGRRAYGGPPFSAMGRASGGKFIPVKKAWYVGEGRGDNGGKFIRARKGVIQRPIEAINAYEDAAQLAGTYARKVGFAGIEAITDALDEFDEY